MGRITVELIRHGMTGGNAQHRYIGAGTDEDLCDDGIRAAAVLCDRLGSADLWLLSPMRRCLETACLAAGMPPQELRRMIAQHSAANAFIHALQERCPKSDIRVEPDLRECDFGTFEGHNWEELSGDPAYQAWIDSEGKTSFPGGEDQAGFTRRCADAFQRQMTLFLLQRMHEDSLVRIVAHGGTIMSLMDAYGLPDESGVRKTYYEYSVPNGTIVRTELICQEDTFGLQPREII